MLPALCFQSALVSLVAEPFWFFRSSLGVNLLMAEEVYQLEIAVRVLATLTSWLPMMDVQLFFIEETFLARSDIDPAVSEPVSAYWG